MFIALDDRRAPHPGGVRCFLGMSEFRNFSKRGIDANRSVSDPADRYSTPAGWDCVRDLKL